MTLKNSFSYKKSGVDIDVADQAKRQMKDCLAADSPRVLNTLGAFASLYDFHFPEIKSPVLVMKMEEPGSKQLLAAQHGLLANVGVDLINHLINDTIMMGAKVVAIQDTIICGKLEKEVVVGLVNSMAEACRAQGCDLLGGETSEQPRVIPEGSYILSAASVGVVDRDKIIDGSKIAAGDAVIAVASNGPHTNGYTLIRSLLEADPGLASEPVGAGTFLEAVLRPHLCYNSPLQELFNKTELHGLAHVTGGGIVDNLSRIIPEGMSAAISLSKVRVPQVFRTISAAGKVSHGDMLRTFNMGVGMVIVINKEEGETIRKVFEKHGSVAYEIGEIASTESDSARVFYHEE